LYECTNGRVFAATSTTLFEVFSGFSFLSRGTIPTGTQPVSMVDNGIQLLLSIEGQGLLTPFATNVLTTVPLTGPQTFGRVQYISGWFVTNEPGTRRFWYSALLDGLTWDALAFYEADARADIVMTILADHNELWVFGSQTIEIWLPTGNSLSPFARSSATFLEQGTVAPWSVASIDSTVFWLGGTPRGMGPAYRARGYEPQRISTNAFEYARSKIQVAGSGIAFTARHGGSAFYGVWWPDTETTWLWDNLVSTWVELATLNDDGSLGPYPCKTHCLAFDDHLWGSTSDGKLFIWDAAYHFYGTRPLYRERTSPHVRQDQQPIIYSCFELVAESGVGLDGGVIPGSDPLVRLSWSDDGGKSFCYPLERSLGKIGEGRHLVRWRRLGRAKSQRAWRCVITDPVPVSILSARLEVS
jgi:hypothetical protein